MMITVGDADLLCCSVVRVKPIVHWFTWRCTSPSASRSYRRLLSVMC